MRTTSPFPGMDPWLESFWGDVHHTLISSLRRQMFPQLPQGLYAAIEENVYVVDVESDRQQYRPDVSVFDSGAEMRLGQATRDTGGVARVAIAEPIRQTFPTEPVTEGHIEIRDRRAGNALVSVIKVFSPTNKMDLRGRSAYTAKRAAYIAANVNIVELDLLRGGDHLIGVPPEYLDPVSVSPYKCAIRRADSPVGQTRVDYYRFPLRERLLRIPIPLRQSDADILVDLQAPIDTAYEEGGFALRIDYTQAPIPPLLPTDAAWATEMINLMVS